MMHDSYYAPLIMNKTDLICYVSDPITYELHYMNHPTKAITGDFSDDYKGKLCYKVLQGKDAPCEFCTNDKLKENEWYNWSFHNEKFDVYVDIQDTLIRAEDDRLLRLELARDITTSKKQMTNLSDNLELERAVSSCLKVFQFETDIDKAISKFLNEVGKYYGAQRAYIFDFDYVNNVINNTYEWCGDTSEPQIENLQNIPIANVADWVERFEKYGEFFITCLDDDVDNSSESYDILKAQGINSLLAAPILRNGVIIGFLGVDDATQYTDNFELLRTVSFFVYSEVEKRSSIEQLELLSYTDTLTGVYNRNKYISELKRLQSINAQNIGVCFADVNGLKKVNDTYGHEFGDILIQESANVLKEIFDSKSIFRVGGDEFVVICPEIDKDKFETMVVSLKDIVNQNEKANISIGHNWNDGQMELEKQIIQADALMYNDKQNYYRSLAYGKQQFTLTAKEQMFADISNKKIQILLDPIIDMSTGKTVAAQCIVEKICDDTSNLSLNQVVRLYEEEGVMVDLDNYVLRTVLEYQRTIINQHSPLKVYVQLSSATFSQENCAQKIGMLCDEYGVDKNLLIIEMKPDLCRLDKTLLKDILLSFSQNGLSISIDNFGTDNANADILILHDFHTLKIASDIIQNIETNSIAFSIVESILTLCKKFPNVHALAKSVDTKSCYDLVKSMNCELAKGDFFSGPLYLDDFTEYLKNA